MRTVTTILATALGAALLSACATTSPVEVTRFHLGAPIDRGTIAVEPLIGGGAASLEYKTYAAAVQTELMRLGYTAPAPGATAAYLATVNFTRVSRGALVSRPPVSIGLGGGSFGGGRRGGVGVGGGVSFGLGKNRSRDLIVSELAVQIKNRTDGAAIWEGRAQTEAKEGADAAQANTAAAKLAGALFRGFPGESGRTISVR